MHYIQLLIDLEVFIHAKPLLIRWYMDMDTDGEHFTEFTTHDTT